MKKGQIVEGIVERIEFPNIAMKKIVLSMYSFESLFNLTKSISPSKQSCWA